MRPPSRLHTDADFAQACHWLGACRLIIHVPLCGEVWFERKD
jgi:hypothetical protein